MNKIRIQIFALLFSLLLILPSCATVLGGRVTDCQRTRPAKGQPSREIRAGYLIADIILLALPFTIVDFITGAIYKPCDK
jgi:hypothetical protein